MGLYFRPKANSCSFMGSPGIHCARTAARGSTHFREMRATTSPWILGLWVTQHRRARRTPFDLIIKGGEISSHAHPESSPDYPSFQNWCQNLAQAHSDAPAAHMQCAICDTDFKARGCEARAKHASHHITTLQNHFSRLLRYPWLEIAYRIFMQPDQ